MNADGFRQLYAYHFALNRKVWDEYIMPLSDAAFVQDIAYSQGSIRNHMVHMLGADQRWFAGLSGQDVPDFPEPAAYADRTSVRAAWDTVEQMMRDYLAALKDEHLPRLFTQGLSVWQVLFHVLNHGTDHRAQVLAMLNQHHGVATGPQDYALFIFGRI